jgi:enoyl-CoA hydratase
MAAMGPSRLDLSKPVYSCGGRACRGWRHGTGALVRYPGDGRNHLHGGLLPPLGHSTDRRWDSAPAASGGRRPRDGPDPDRPPCEMQTRLCGLDCANTSCPKATRAPRPEALAHEIARFPQSCMRADRRSVRAQHGLSMCDALRQEWRGSKGEVTKGVEGAARFAGGKGRGGDFRDV